VGGGNDFGRDAALDSSGRIVLAGATDNGSDLDLALARYNADGSLDGGFGTGGIVTDALGGLNAAQAVAVQADGRVRTSIGFGNDYSYEMEIQGDGKILVSGAAHKGADFDLAVLRYNSNGSLDTGLGKVTVDVAGGDDFALDVALDGSKIVLAGQAWNGSSYDFALTRIRTS
jgi:uncharacterized delta-60 repeat protein